MMAALKLRVLEEYLQELDEFEKPKIHLEQYVTRPHVASHLLHAAQTSFADLAGRSVADLGCGCGALALGAAALGASYIVGFEVDADAVNIFYKNAKKFGLPGQWNFPRERKEQFKPTEVISSRGQGETNSENESPDSSEEDESENESDTSDSSGFESISNCAVDVVLCNVTAGDGLGSSDCRWHKAFDTVIMNPPFGTKSHGADMAFLKSALGMATKAVYSLHKTSTRKYVLAKGKEWGGPGTTAEVLAKLRFDLPKSYKFHSKKSVDVEVDFVRFGLSDPESSLHRFSKALKIR